MGQWVMVALMITVVSYFGYSIIASPQRVAPPGVTPVPARLAAEAGMGAKKIRPQTVASAKPRAQISRDAVRNPAQNAAHLVATVDEPARLARDLALAPVRNNVPPPVATNQPPPVIAREPALNPVGEAVPPQPDAVTSEAVFHPPLPLGERYGEQNRNSRVTLRVHRSTRLAVLGTRHHVWIDRILRAGDTYRVPNRSDLSLSVPDAGAVEVILDDNTVGFAGSDGIAIRGFSLQPQSIIKRYHWLQAEDFSAARPAKPPLPR
jgi:cytoskeleton protein RodZ